MRKNKQWFAYNFANDSFEFLQESWFIWEAMLNIPLGVSSDTQTGRKKTWPHLVFFNPALLGVWIPEETLLVAFDLLLETRVRVFIRYPNTGIEFRKEKKKIHDRHNQGIKADFEVRVSDIQSSLTKVSFISSSSYATCTSPIMHLICPLKFCISIVFNFSWDGCDTQQKWKTKVMQNFEGQIRCIMGDVQVPYGQLQWVWKDQTQNIIQTTANIYLT